jgi:hypothetical protein
MIGVFVAGENRTCSKGSPHFQLNQVQQLLVVPPLSHLIHEHHEANGTFTGAPTTLMARASGASDHPPQKPTRSLRPSAPARDHVLHVIRVARDNPRAHNVALSDSYYHVRRRNRKIPRFSLLGRLVDLVVRHDTFAFPFRRQHLRESLPSTSSSRDPRAPNRFQRSRAASFARISLLCHKPLLFSAPALSHMISSAIFFGTGS